MRCTEFVPKENNGILNFPNRNYDMMTFQQWNSEKILTGIPGICNRIGIPLPMGVTEIGTENLNSQPSLAESLTYSLEGCHIDLNIALDDIDRLIYTVCKGGDLLEPWFQPIAVAQRWNALTKITVWLGVRGHGKAIV